MIEIIFILAIVITVGGISYYSHLQEKKELCYHEFQDKGIIIMDHSGLPINVLNCTKCGTNIYLPLKKEDDLNEY